MNQSKVVNEDESKANAFAERKRVCTCLKHKWGVMGCDEVLYELRIAFT